MSKLVIMRHGESVANHTNTFTGWSDVPLTKKGAEEAIKAGKRLKETGIQFSDVHTSVLKRAIVTAEIVLDVIDQDFIPEHKSWRLNERHYGALRGQNKEEVRKRVGDTQFMKWRRSFYAVPPKLDKVPPVRKYRRLGVVEPPAESLKMAYDRMIPYWQDEIAPRLLDGKNQLVVAHGSTLRALIKYLENISDKGIDGVEVKNGRPIIYTFDPDLDILDKTYLK
ncbi:2,3-bisphosphoglycerate-dependent phosphoglycerate mutase [Fructilactobacillus fructivorans]|uniref:2,3-bisphosphoglycerate-dependent phosphoglycerate mutase n=1 Tax=Fructilactobacillus fructivorans TaxID=1614 RepID=A0AAE6TWQ6_9LACO|nr:2,3-diphosphoglycerate-dependent phosphoglycerate mutase [Fructilactobacillus fructivorans]KRK57690.1 phosphoglyceromutase [Fructilactobacillus fructivorans]KRN12769.1 phosphoglyceromutase [Fructilactobacillus fructivorans]KRN40568.1 phosphoglyceromutase [Fructilactobacillus fructivorans]KRN42337.1 phosphoglyceromutase [Fructilactobacillus fructivorans]QFX93029.1 2,3-bisphosphoglycerate-dependent phosphoglycerate mutase [Fructilactobacillus fructivorans]